MLEELVKQLKKSYDLHGKNSEDFDKKLNNLLYFVEHNKIKPVTLNIQDSVVGVQTKFN